ncbi:MULTISPECIES: TetR/AcrR family transcriptional regulator [Paenarthrobacter]|uniref:TetR/AcrR family transcriptional regulator n=1 Tax=Paenarthrobacter TaxID=1742992 RepID=UPI0023668D74|nr:MULTISPECIES: TetR family transcriptional regulator [Paenarthrobacter]MDD7836662.1 TetR family transcriptional regulator [Paenarthrobacter sp. AB444]MDP9937094.1 AcrR family transcriptional regulator [Paenarthrobacter nicotinovorans]
MSLPQLRRGRRSPGDHSREAIVAAARTLFAEQGFEGTSLRQVAREAGVDPAMVHHFFKGKDELFAASVELPADPAEVLSDVENVAPTVRAEAIVRAVLELWEGPARHALVAFARGTIGSQAKTALLREMVTRAVLPRITAGLPGSAEEIRLRGNLVATQVVGLMLARYVIRMQPLASAPRDEVVRLVAPNIQRYLTGNLDSPK